MADYATRPPIRRFFNLLRVDKQDILSIYVYALFNGIVSLSLPLGIQAIINLIGGGQVSTSWIILVIFVILGVGLTGAMQIMQLTITENLQQKIFTRSAFEFAYRIPRLKLEAVENVHTPELVNRFFDTLSVQKGLSKILIDFSSASLQVLFGLILLSLYHPFFILFSLLLLGILYLIFRFTSPKGLITSLKESKHKYEVAHWLEELARTMETFKLAGRSPLPLSRTDTEVSKYLSARQKHFKTLLTQYINLVGFKVIIAAGLLVIGGSLVLNQQMNIGQFVASEIIIILVLSSVEKLILSMETIYDVLTSIEKLGGVTDIPLERDTGNPGIKGENEGLAIKVDNLNYKFGNATLPLLEGISTDIKPGEKILLAGYSGSGKSTLLQLIAALYESFGGAISYDGIPLGNWCKEDLRSLIGDSLSKEDIFQGTVQENISLGKPDVGLKEVQEISDVVGLSTFIQTLPDGYNTHMVSEGKQMPRGIRLKIMLARCLAGNSRLILLEENFNQLHVQDKNRVLNYLFSKPWTVIAVSNDPEVAQRFDRILALKDGKIVGGGRLADLKNDAWFNEVFYPQKA